MISKEKILDKIVNFLDVQEAGKIDYNGDTPTVVFGLKDSKFYQEITKPLKQLTVNKSIEKYLEIVLGDENMLPGESISSAKSLNFQIEYEDGINLKEYPVWKDLSNILLKNGFRIKAACTASKYTYGFVQIEEDPSWRSGKYRGGIHGSNFGLDELYIKPFDSWLNENENVNTITFEGEKYPIIDPHIYQEFIEECKKNTDVNPDSHIKVGDSLYVLNDFFKYWVYRTHEDQGRPTGGPSYIDTINFYKIGEYNPVKYTHILGVVILDLTYLKGLDIKTMAEDFAKTRKLICNVKPIDSRWAEDSVLIIFYPKTMKGYLHGKEFGI